MVCVGIVLALQRHEFTHPNGGLVAIVVMILPWVLDMASCAIPEERADWLMVQRFRWPLLVAWTAVVVATTMWLITNYQVTNDFAPFVLTMLVGEMSATSGWKFGAVVWAVCVGCLLSYSSAWTVNGEWIWAFAFTIAFMGGNAYRWQVQLTTLLSQAQEQLARTAVEEERTRLARDVHDLVAHSLAVTMLHLSGARLALQAGDLGDATEALEEAEVAGRTAMAEIHRTVGLLGSGTTPVAATPRAVDLPDLVTEFRRAGLAVDFDLRGDLDAVPLAVGLASYRVVQESLANAVKHAPGAPVHLQVAVHEYDIDIVVANPVTISAPGPGGGNGLKGMAERTQLLGGSASAANGDGTWRVHAAIPWEMATT